jgi:hypothetical protein
MRCNEIDLDYVACYTAMWKGVKYNIMEVDLR